MHLPTQTFTLELRPRERPCGIKGLRGPEKERVRTETVVSRRIATIAATLQEVGKPWLAWTESSATGAAEPTDLPDWAALRERRTLWGDATTGIRTAGTANPPAAGQGPEDPAWLATMRTQLSQSTPSTKKPRLVRSEPHKMVVAEGDTDDEGPPEASLGRTAADNPDRLESKKEIRERENAAYLGGMRNPGKAWKRAPGLRTVGR